MSQRRLAPLCGNSQFEQVFSSADSKQHAGDLFLLLKRNNESTHRIGLITPKRQLKRAVDRNRFRRVARACVAKLPTDQHYDIVALVKRMPSDLHSTDISRRLDTLLSRLVKKANRTPA